MNEQAINRLYEEAIRQNWNTEMEWLWLAAQVNTDEQRLCCLERALHINPHNRATRRQLLALQRSEKSA